MRFFFTIPRADGSIDPTAWGRVDADSKAEAAAEALRGAVPPVPLPVTVCVADSPTPSYCERFLIEEAE